MQKSNTHLQSGSRDRHEADADETPEEEMDWEGGDGDEEDDEIRYKDIDPDKPPWESSTSSRTPTPPPKKKKISAITPQQLRVRGKAGRWQSGKAVGSRTRLRSPIVPKNQWFSLSSRPYLKAAERRQVQASIKKGLVYLGRNDLRRSYIFHVDFSEPEIFYLQYLARALYGRRAFKARDVRRDLRHLLKKGKSMPETIQKRVIQAAADGFIEFDTPPPSLRNRTADDISKYLDDLMARSVSHKPRVLRLERDDNDSYGDASRPNTVQSLLLTREIIGNRGLSMSRNHRDLNAAFRCAQEDHLEPRTEWTDCAGDIMTISWLSNTHFICGTTTHSDSHNQQYNKAGNLLLGSVSTPSMSVKAFPDHRIIRPVVASGSGRDLMESPWLYTSVVSSDYQLVNDLAFTSSFDHTVRLWKVAGNDLVAFGTWHHQGRVNFVVSSQHPDGMVATAADVPTKAVRVYRLGNSLDLDSSAASAANFTTYSCTRVDDADYIPSDKWAYYPSAIRWGLASQVRHLLLVGYSPRSLSGDDRDIPDEKRKTGELCLWNTLTNTHVKVNNAASSNVFEVVWHPEQPIFAAATSASGLEVDHGVKTQIRVFHHNQDTDGYTAYKTLDCTAADINELSLR